MIFYLLYDNMWMIIANSSKIVQNIAFKWDELCTQIVKIVRNDVS